MLNWRKKPKARLMLPPQTSLRNRVGSRTTMKVQERKCVLTTLLQVVNLIDTSQLPADVVVVGSAALDITAQELLGTQSALAIHSTAPGHVKLSLGGVARNMAEALHRVMSQKYPELSSVLVAPVGYDAFGQIMVDEMTQIGMRTDGLIRSEKQSAVCNMILDSKGALIGGIADMSIMQTLSGSSVSGFKILYRIPLKTTFADCSTFGPLSTTRRCIGREF